MTPEPGPETPDATEETATEVERLGALLAETEARARESQDAYLRAVAETENLRKRSAREVEAASRYAIDRFAGELLEVRDSLERGIAAGEGAGAGRLIEGMEATFRLMNKAFEKCGISVLDPAGEPFNPEYHEAMATMPTDQAPPGVVLEVVQKGYVLNGRLLRPARVVISRAAGPPAS
jgi:molecular chaperone GrpE